MSPIPPRNTSVNLPMGDDAEGARWANPNDKPMEA